MAIELADMLLSEMPSPLAMIALPQIILFHIIHIISGIPFWTIAIFTALATCLMQTCRASAVSPYSIVIAGLTSNCMETIQLELEVIVPFVSNISSKNAIDILCLGIPQQGLRKENCSLILEMVFVESVRAASGAVPDTTSLRSQWFIL